MTKKRLISFAVLICIVICGSISMAGVNVSPVSTGEVQSWLHWVIPLPKEVKIDQQVTLPASDVKLTFYGHTGVLEQNALRKLRSLFLDMAGVDGSEGGEFGILLGICDKAGRLGDITVPDTNRLSKLLNKEQAYLIRPMGANRLVLTALDSRGLFYAALTMRQLLESRFKGDNITIPLAVITDWPDLAERGEWGGSSTRDIEWLAERKMNLVEFHSLHKVTDDGKAISAISRSLLRRGRMNGVKMVPIISHLNGMGRRGVYKAYPELRGKGDKAVYDDGDRVLYAPCASNPKLSEILADWMIGYASYEGVRDISCWLSEPSNLRCECEECKKSDQFALETRAYVKAWRIAQKQYPNLRIRILLTQGSYNSNEKVLAEIPTEVGVTYYDGGRTYDSSPEPMIYPLLEAYAAKGHWLGCYPQLTPSFWIVSPWSGPQFIRFRMTEFVDKKLSSLAGYVVPDNRLYDFNVTAAGEWSWNAHGRDEKAFSIAWATRKGFADPKAVADWAVKLGAVAWDLYGAELVRQYLSDPDTVVEFVLAGTQPMFGEGFLKYIPNKNHLERNIKTCQECLHMVNQIGSPAMVAETKAIMTYYDIVNRLCRIRTLLAEKENVGADKRKKLQKELNRLTSAGDLNVEALKDWERSVGVGSGGERFLDGVEATEDTIQAVASALEPFGVHNPVVTTMRNQISEWSS
jgi:regulator of sigma D